MIFESQASLKQRIEEVTSRQVYGSIPIFTDTSSYMAIYGGCVLRLNGHDYFVLGDTKEGRFGIEDQPKFWVKYAVDLTSGAAKIIKLVFHEQFTFEVAGFRIHCQRSPQKEAEFLAAARGMPHFMQGESQLDAAGNLVRIIDRVRGPSLLSYIGELGQAHEVYFHEVLPPLVHRLIASIEALAKLHQQGLHHGDVRNDHLLVERETGSFVWIDFDYRVNFADFDVWSMGNVVAFVVGKGMHTFHGISQHKDQYPHLAADLDEHDAMVLFRHRVANLRKLFPYIPRVLNDILMRFSAGTIAFYDDLFELSAALADVFGRESTPG